jgi:hypothetical protein
MLVIVWSLIGCSGGSIGEEKRFSHKEKVLGIEFLADGKQFVSAEWGDDGARLWNIETGKVEAELALNASAVAVSPDGRTVAVGTFPGQVFLWDTRDRCERRTWTIDEGSVCAMDFSPDGSQLAVTQGPRWIDSSKSEGLPRYSIWLWDVDSGDLVHTIEDLSSPSNSVRFVDSDQVFFTNWSEAICLWSLSRGAAVWRSGITEYHFGGFVFDQPRAVVSDDKSLVFWRYNVYRLSDGKPQVGLKVVDGGNRNLIDGCFINGNRCLLTGDSQGDLTIWDLRTGKRLWRRKASKNGAAVTALALSPDGKTFLTGCFNPIGGFGAMQRNKPINDPYIRLWKLPE